MGCLAHKIQEGRESGLENIIQYIMCSDAALFWTGKSLFFTREWER